MNRKSSYGRTALFLPDPNVLFREVKGMNHVKGGYKVYHTLPPAYTEPGAACWHCCETIDDHQQVVPVPRVHDPELNTFHVFGRCCSPSCAKAYILEHSTCDRGNQLNLLMKMLREVYDVHDSVKETPPRPALARFGGVFDPKSVPKARCDLVEPPFVSYCMIIEEREESARVVNNIPSVSEAVMEEAEDITHPSSPALFHKFVKKRSSPDN